MISTETVRAHFQDKHAWMTNVIRTSFPVVRARRGEDGLEEAVHNTITLAYENVLRCAANGKIRDGYDLTRFTKQSLWWAVRHTCAGRSIVSKPSAEKKSGDVYERMARHDQCDIADFVGRSTPVPDAASFRVDAPAFLATLTGRQRGMATGLMAGMTTTDVAREHGVTPAAVSQFRTRFRMLWREYFGEV